MGMTMMIKYLEKVIVIIIHFLFVKSKQKGDKQSSSSLALQDCCLNQYDYRLKKACLIILGLIEYSYVYSLYTKN